MNDVFTSTIISRGSVFSLHLSAAKERKEPNMCVCAYVCLLAVSDGEGMFPPREASAECMCVRMYVNELVALQFPGSQGAAFSERHCMFTVLMHIHWERHTLTHSPTQRGLLGWKPTRGCFVRFDSLCWPVKRIFWVQYEFISITVFV